MHELPVTESILNICVKHAEANNAKKIVAIELKVGGMSDLEDEWMQKYFDYLAKDSIAEGAKLKIERTPVVVQCNLCAHTFNVDIKKREKLLCPECEGTCTLISGKEYHIKNMEVV